MFAAAGSPPGEQLRRAPGAGAGDGSACAVAAEDDAESVSGRVSEHAEADLALTGYASRVQGQQVQLRLVGVTHAIVHVRLPGWAGSGRRGGIHSVTCGKASCRRPGSAPMTNEASAAPTVTDLAHRTVGRESGRRAARGSAAAGRARLRLGSQTRRCRAAAGPAEDGPMRVRIMAATVACLGVIGVSDCGSSVQSCGVGDYGSTGQRGLPRRGKRSDRCSPPTSSGCRWMAG